MAAPELRPFISAVGLSNFRGFKSPALVPLAPLTYVVGPNSSGKSSLFDALLFLAQSRFAPVGSFVPRWNGSLVDLGSYEDTVYAHKPRLRIGITVELAVPARDLYLSQKPPTELSPFRVEYRLKLSKADPIGVLDSVSITDVASGYRVDVTRTGKFRLIVALTAGDAAPQIFVLRATDLEQSALSLWSRLIRDKLRKLQGDPRPKKNPTPHDRAIRRLQSAFSPFTFEHFFYSFERVSSGRGGPQRWYSIGATAREVARSAGRGALFDTVDPSVLVPTEDIRSQRRARKAAAQLKTDVAAALSRLNIADQIASSSISPYHATIEVRDSVTKIPSNLMEVGFGASQALPVIRACLSTSTGPLFVEQPEIHLHPRAQAEIAEMICDVSYRRQVIVETHSVHMINRARLRIARGEMPSSDVAVVYVSRTREGSQVSSISIDDQGDFTGPWPGGFFEERYEDTKKLLKLRHSPKNKS